MLRSRRLSLDYVASLITEADLCLCEQGQKQEGAPVPVPVGGDFTSALVPAACRAAAKSGQEESG